MRIFSFNLNKEVNHKQQPQAFDYDKVVPIQLETPTGQWRQRQRQVRRIFRRIGFLARQAQHTEEKWIKGVIAGIESEIKDLKALTDVNPSTPSVPPTVQEYND